MEKVTGIGGLFFRATNPSKLTEWYEKHLGINPVPTSYDQLPWVQESGPTVFAAFEENTDYFGKASQSWMINFRVNDLYKMVEQLQKAGIEITVNEDVYPNGRFASLRDPEDNLIELWEPTN